MTISEDSTARRPTWAEIDLDALSDNLRVIREHVGREQKVMAAVKADAYGHGAVPCARRLEAEGVDWFGVALPEEGIELRAAGITKPILCLGGFWEGQQNACLQQNLTPVVYRLDMIESLDRAARDAGVVADVHVKIDTGMGRLGVRSDDVAQFCEALSRFQNIRVDGLMTHLAAADDPDQEDFTKAQLKQFENAVNKFRARGFSPSLHSRRELGRGLCLSTGERKHGAARWNSVRIFSRRAAAANCNSATAAGHVPAFADHALEECRQRREAWLRLQL